jgi:uridine kinase
MNLKIYQAGLKFMFVNAVKRLFGGEVYFEHSLDHGIYGTIEAQTPIDQAALNKIKEHMMTMVQQNLPFEKKIVSKKEAYDFYKKKGYKEKAFNVLNINNVVVSMFSLEGQYNYLYTHDIPASTGVIQYFDLFYVDVNKFVLIYPFNGKIDFTFRKKLFDTFADYNDWSHRLGVPYVSNLNNIVAQGTIGDLIRKNDIIQNARINDVAKDIIEKNKKIILLAGPSSSGKTTTSRKLALYLASHGVNAKAISLDDFYLDNDKKPIMADGKVDYESIDAIDINFFSDCLNRLLAGEAVQLPIYDFTIGTHTLDNPITLEENEVVVVEGLHAINPKLISLLDQSVIYKVYISPLTPLGIDRHNYVSTTDNRLLRRMIRDFRTRGCNAEKTILTWGDVRSGEEQYIFPHTDTVDQVINTAYIYEMGVLKVFCEPLLMNIPMDSEAYDEARRLLGALNVFYPISSELIPHDNVLREFIGGSVFEK